MLRKLRKKLKLRYSLTKRSLITPSFPKNPDGKVLVHVGCGKRNSPEFINIDAQPLAHVHIVTDKITSLDDFADDTVDLVYMCHILEHIPLTQLHDVLLEMKRILKPGGVLRLSVPDFDHLVEIYNASEKDVTAISRQLMGGHDDQYNVHYLIFNHRYLSSLLTELGFDRVIPWDPHNCLYHNFKDKATRTRDVDGKEFPISLNLEAIK